MKNTNYHFIVRVTDLTRRNAFIAEAKKLGLTISGPGAKGGGIAYAVVGTAISVGTSNKYHVNWSRNHTFYARKGIVPVLDINLDYKEAVAKLKLYARAVGVKPKVKRPLPSVRAVTSKPRVVIDVDGEKATIGGKNFRYWDVLDLVDIMEMQSIDNIAWNKKTKSLMVNGVFLTAKQIKELKGIARG